MVDTLIARFGLEGVVSTGTGHMIEVLDVAITHQNVDSGSIAGHAHNVFQYILQDWQAEPREGALPLPYQDVIAHYQSLGETYERSE